ncbi:hypothetical protein B7P43_G04229 [Cryptotermes secundus]|uniref:C2H2-type domain-containing protein n=2 Tax=Cryptotermes secundus TaxID=105785 RepID=A0A2J7RJY4_9NEOP|nr:hypothetical protein B7P43_G04229 [Cryptotermes secundus]
MVKSKVSYVVLKSDVVGKGKPAVILKHGGHVEPLSELGGQKPASGAENTTGPWLCHSCGSNEEPIHFETYYLYRRHLQDVHMEKIDARICEHCGHRASKRNLLLYHLYTKHGVPPPRNCQFPKCDQCDYVALSESLLIKHRNNHSNNKEFVCKVCNATFKSNGALQGHMQTNLHSDPSKKLYDCPFCQKPFVRNINLKAHIRTSHKEVIRKMDEEEKLHMEATHKQFANLQHFEDGEEAHASDAAGEDSLNADEEEDGEMVEVPVIDAVMQKPSTGTVMLPSGVTVLAEAPAVQSLVPSSEAEALSNVASGIAASLGLADTLTGEQTVIVLDDNQEFILHSTEIVGEEITSTDGNDVDVSGVGAGELQEYIVPEIMPDEGQEQEDQSYSGPLSDLEHYSGETNSAMTVPSHQTATAPPPVSVAVSVAGGDEVTMVLTDHDYAPMRDTSGDGVMFLIAQPTEQAEEHNVKCPVSDRESEPELPVLEKEPPPPELTAESACAVPSEIKYSNIPPVLTRESIIPHEGSDSLMSAADEQIISESVVSEGNDVMVTEEMPPTAEGGIQEVSEEANNQETQMEHVEQLNRNEGERGKEIVTNGREQEVKVIMVGSVDDLRLKETSATESIIQEDKEQEAVVVEGERVGGEDEHDDSDETKQASTMKTYSPMKKPVANNAPVRRQPPVQMADIVKEWDDFDDDEDNISEPSQQSESEKKPEASEGEPEVLRGPVSGEQ